MSKPRKVKVTERAAKKASPAPRAKKSATADSGPISQCKLRVACVGVFFFFCFSAISYRVVELTVFPPTDGDKVAAPRSAKPNKDNEIPLMALVEHNDEAIRKVLSKLEKEVHNSDVVLPRNNITDRNGIVVATSLETASLYADTRRMKRPAEVAAQLKKILPNIDLKTTENRLKSGRSFVWIKRNLIPREQEKVNELGIPGLHFQQEYTRVYPQRELLSHTLGFVGIDNAGLAGIEKYEDEKLRDTDIQRPLELSIDLRLQYLLHDQLTRTVQDFKAIGAAGVIAEVKTGEILAMSSLPDFDPHHPAKANADTLFNRVSLGAYEMGSTFKTFTLAMALEYGTTSLHDGYDASRPIKIARFTINDTHPKYRWLSIPEIFAYSSNIGTVKIIQDVGIERQKSFLGKLGLMQPIQVELPERASPLYPNPWGQINMMTISYGHGMSVSPLHLVQAFRTVIDDGRNKRLTLLKDGNTKEDDERLLSRETVHHVQRMLRMVVQYGTGRQGDAPGYRVGGKTGTAEKVKAGGYAKKAMLSSFLGAFPMEDPQYIIYVVVDEPVGNKNTYGYATGGWVAAPTVSRIVSQMAPMLGIAPEFNEAPDEMDLFWAETQKRAEEGKSGKFHAATYRTN